MVSLAAADGEESYRTRCALCHGGNAAGSDRAGSILATLDASGPEQLARIITEGVPSRGMPGIEIPADELTPLIAYLKELAATAPPAARDPRAPQPRAATIALAGGDALEGTVLNESGFDAQFRTSGGDILLLRREGDAYREAAHRAVRRLAVLPRQLYRETATVRWTRSIGTTSADWRCSGSFPFPTCR